jgi:hypothetical protein
MILLGPLGTDVHGSIAIKASRKRRATCNAMEATDSAADVGDGRLSKEMKAPPTCTRQLTLEVLTELQQRFQGDWPLISPDRFT